MNAPESLQILRILYVATLHQTQVAEQQRRPIIDFKYACCLILRSLHIILACYYLEFEILIHTMIGFKLVIFYDIFWHRNLPRREEKAGHKVQLSSM
jgi:hypothetical protein